MKVARFPDLPQHTTPSSIINPGTGPTVLRWEKKFIPIKFWFKQMMPRPKGVHIRVEGAPSQESVSAPVVVFVVSSWSSLPLALLLPCRTHKREENCFNFPFKYCIPFSVLVSLGSDAHTKRARTMPRTFSHSVGEITERTFSLFCCCWKNLWKWY